jgi:hypothetical protein
MWMARGTSNVLAPCQLLFELIQDMRGRRKSFFQVPPLLYFGTQCLPGKVPTVQKYLENTAGSIM